MDNVQLIYLDVLDNKDSKFIYTKQSDVGRTVVFTLFRNGKQIELTNCTAQFVLCRSDKQIVKSDLQIDKTTNTASIMLTNRHTRTAGLLPYQITVSKDGKTFSTVTNYMLCEKRDIPVDLDMPSAYEIGLTWGEAYNSGMTWGDAYDDYWW